MVLVKFLQLTSALAFTKERLFANLDQNRVLLPLSRVLSHGGLFLLSNQRRGWPRVPRPRPQDSRWCCSVSSSQELCLSILSSNRRWSSHPEILSSQQGWKFVSQESQSGRSQEEEECCWGLSLIQEVNCTSSEESSSFSSQDWSSSQRTLASTSSYWPSAKTLSGSRWLFSVLSL